MTEQETQDQEDLTIGQYLRQEREKKNLTVKTISQHTKISTSKLELIEENNFDELPSLAYVTGFVKSYAKSLGLDQNYCLSLLDKAYGVKKEAIPEEHLEKLSDTDKPSIESFNGLPLGKIVLGVAVITIIVGLLVFVGQNRVPDEPIQEITPKSVDSDTPLAESRPPVPAERNDERPENQQTTQQETPEKDPKEAQETEQDVKEEDEQIEQTDEAEQDEDSDEDSEERPMSELDVNIRPFPGPTFNWDNQMTQERIDELIPDDKKVTPKDGEHHIYIKAINGETWLTYKSDDSSIRRFVLKEGRDVLLRGKTHRVFLGNINATEIFINNRPIQVESRTGVKSLVVPRESFKDYYLPLFIYPKTGGVLTSEEYLETIKDLEE